MNGDPIDRSLTIETLDGRTKIVNHGSVVFNNTISEHGKPDERIFFILLILWVVYLQQMF